MNSEEIRSRFLKFFEKRGHAVIPSASLVPENDPSVLFTTAGMHPLVPYLLGEKHPSGNRLVDVQKCIRTGDIDEVGNYSHHTFFEMLGNWSLGDYFKEDAIKWSYEFLTSPEWLGLDKNRIAVSVFEGDEDAPFDEEAYEIWKQLGISEKRIAKLPKKNNWWGPAGEIGPCGPDTEMFYWVGDPNETPESFNDDNPLWLEVWNDVFMQYNKTKEGKFEPLTQKNVDTGMGLERTLAVINGLDDNYRTELFWPIIQKIEELSGKKYEGENTKAMRIVADHLKASTFILGDEKSIAPNNTDQGYVLRRLIRRAVRYGKQLGIKFFTREIASVVVEMYKDVYPELSRNKDFIFSNLLQEEEKFEKTLLAGESALIKFAAKNNPIDKITNPTGRDLFFIYSTFGFPFELSLEVIKDIRTHYNRDDATGILLSIEEIERVKEEFEREMKKHQELSRAGAEQKFKGGLADHSEEVVKYHTATHLLHQALHDVLGDEVGQKGSNLTSERLRFDFSFPRKLTDEEKQKVEDIVNEKIGEKLAVQRVVLPKEEAEKTGAHHAFDQKYPDEVSVYYIGDSLENAYSKEFCGGPHVENISTLGHFKITKEEAVSAGVRRIKAVLE